MTVELWVGQDFDTTHERIAIAKFLKDMREHFGDSEDYYFVFANFFMDGKAIDWAVIKRSAIIVIENKKCIDPFTATENGNWITDKGYKIQTDGHNPFEQVRKYRLLVTDYLKKNQERFLEPNKINNVNFVHTSAIVSVDPKIHPQTKNEITGVSVTSWFSLTGLDELWQTVYQRTNTSIDLSEAEIRKLIRLLNLKQGDPIIGMPIEQAKEVQIDLPDPPEFFVGRIEQLGYLNRLLLQDSGKTVVIQGDPGAGKTTLAIAFAYLAKDKFRDGIYWVSAEGKTDTNAIVRELAEKINGGYIKTPDHAQAWEIWNKYISNKDILGIIDNADELDFNFRFKSKKCKIIFTTRSIVAQQDLSLSNEDVIKLPTLIPDESIDLMQRILKKEFSKIELETARKLADKLGNLPIGIDRASRYMQVYQTPIKEYLEKKGLDRLDLKPGEKSNIKNRFGQNLDNFPPKMVDFFASLGICRSNSFDLELAKVIGDGIVSDVEDSLNKLRGIAMIDKLSTDRYSFHPLIKEYARELANERGLVDQADARYFGWHENLISDFPVHEDELKAKYPQDPNAQAKVKDENIIRLGKELDGLFATAEWKLGLRDVDLTTFHIYWRNLRGIIETKGITDRAIEILETALEVARKNLELDSDTPFSTSQVENKLMEGYYLAQLGKFYDRAGRLDEAVRTLENAVKIEKDKKRKKNAEMRLGVAQGRKKNFEKAIESLRENLKLSEVEGDDSTLYALNALARALIDSGKAQDAIIHLNRALNIEDNILTDTKSRSITLSEMGRAYKRLKEYPASLDYYNKSLAIINEQINPRAVAVLCNEIGETLGLMRFYQDSFDYYNKSYQLSKSLQDPRSRNITKSRFLRTLKALIQEIKEYKKNKNWTEALPLVKIWLNAEKTMGNPAHEYWALIDYGNIVSYLGDIQGAIDLYDIALINATIQGNLKGKSIAHNCKARSFRSLKDKENKNNALRELRMAEAIEIHLLRDKENKTNALNELRTTDSIKIDLSFDKNQIARILLDKANILLQLEKRDLAARCSESALAYVPNDTRALDMISKSRGNKKHASGLVVGQKGVIKKIINKPAENKHFGFVRLQDSKEVYFNKSASEEVWDNLRENIEVVVDYFVKKENSEANSVLKLSATRVILNYQDS